MTFTRIVVYTFAAVVLSGRCAIAGQRLQCLSESDARSVLQEPRLFDSSFDRCRSELVERLGPSFGTPSDFELRYVFAGLVAYSSAAYGRGANMMVCDTYVTSAIRAASVSGHLVTRNDRAFMVGWFGGAVGDHAQLLVEHSKTGLPREVDHGMLIDPTFAIVAVTDYNSLLTGKRIPADQLVDFSFRGENSADAAKVVKALVNGEYRPLDLYYYVSAADVWQIERGNIPNFLRQRDGFTTPAAVTFKSWYSNKTQ